MSDQFKALILNQDGESFLREIKSIDKNFLKHGDVTVKVEYSGLNYKDALILKNGEQKLGELTADGVVPERVTYEMGFLGVSDTVLKLSSEGNTYIYKKIR